MTRKATQSPALVLLTALCAVTAGCGGMPGGGEAACADHARGLEASPARAAPNEPFQLHGEGFYGEFVCDDSGPRILSRPSGGRPTDGIRVELVQGSRSWPLATVTSREDLSFDAGGLEVPPEARPGEAVVRATSPRVDAGVAPPRAETPFLVLGDPEMDSAQERP